MLHEIYNEFLCLKFWYWSAVQFMCKLYQAEFRKKLVVNFVIFHWITTFLNTSASFSYQLITSPPPPPMHIQWIPLIKNFIKGVADWKIIRAFLCRYMVKTVIILDFNGTLYSIYVTFSWYAPNIWFHFLNSKASSLINDILFTLQETVDMIFCMHFSEQHVTFISILYTHIGYLKYPAHYHKSIGNAFCKYRLLHNTCMHLLILCLTQIFVWHRYVDKLGTSRLN